MSWRAVGVPIGWRSMAVLGTIVVAGLAWIGWPIWDSLTAPSRAQSQAEAPWLMAALVCSLMALGVAMWLDGGRRLDPMAALLSLVVLDVVVRAVLNPAANGLEFVHAIPLLAGMAAGAPAGFFVGASSAILSTITVGLPATTLPSQALVWGISGMLGGLLWRLRPRLAWFASMPLALVAGVVSGVLFNLMGWSQEPGTTLNSFYTGLPPAEVAERIWGYTVETSLVHDLTRGLTTAVILAVIGRPVLAAMRRAVGTDTFPAPVEAREGISADAIARREDRARLDHLWSQGDQPWNR